MKEELLLAETDTPIGKTIERIETPLGGSMILFFTDKTFQVLRTESSWEDTDIACGKLEDIDLFDSEWVSLGLKIIQQTLNAPQNRMRPSSTVYTLQTLRNKTAWNTTPSPTKLGQWVLQYKQVIVRP